MALRLLCTTHCCEGNVFSFSTFWRKQEERTRSWMKTAQSRSATHHVEQQDMSMIVRVICWELECASRKEGDHQQEIALAVLTLLGAGLVETARELKPRRAQPRTRRVQQKRRRQKRFSTLKRSATSCRRTLKAKKTHGQVRGWVPMKRPCQKNSTLERKQVEKSSLGQDPEGRLLPVYDWPKRESCAGDQMGPVFCVQ